MDTSTTHAMGAGKPEQGGAIPGVAGPSYSLWRMCDSTPVLVSVPHAGRCYPPDVLAALRDSGEAQLRLEDRYIDF